MPDTPPPRARGAVERPGGERCRSGGPSGPARRERSVSITWNLGRGKPGVVGRRRPPAGGRSGCPDPGQVCGSSAEGRRTGTGPLSRASRRGHRRRTRWRGRPAADQRTTSQGCPCPPTGHGPDGHPRSAKQALVAGQPPIRRPRGSGTERPRSSSSETRPSRSWWSARIHRRCQPEGRWPPSSPARPRAARGSARPR